MRIPEILVASLEHLASGSATMYGKPVPIYTVREVKVIRLSDHEAAHAADEVRISELEGLLRKLHSDLLMRAEVDAEILSADRVYLAGLWCRVAQLTEQEQKP